MGARTTDEEARQIIRYYESGMKVKEITEKIGKSREAVNRVLNRYGLTWGGWDNSNLDWNAEKMYKQWLKKTYGLDEARKYQSFHQLIAVDREKFLVAAKKEMLAEKKAAYNLLFCGDTPIPTQDPEQPNNAIKIELKPCEVEALNYLTENMQIDKENLIGFLIMKEKLEWNRFNRKEKQ